MVEILKNKKFFIEDDDVFYNAEEDEYTFVLSRERAEKYAQAILSDFNKISDERIINILGYTEEEEVFVTDQFLYEPVSADHLRVEGIGYIY